MNVSLAYYLVTLLISNLETEARTLGMSTARKLAKTSKAAQGGMVVDVEARTLGMKTARKLAKTSKV